MERGLLVPLSPAEETTFRSIATGWTHPDPRTRDVERLIQLGLVERGRGEFRVTILGQRRILLGRATKPLVDKPLEHEADQGPGDYCR